MLLESGYLKRETNQYKIETLSGIFLVHAYVENDEVVSVSFESKVCYMIEKNLQVEHISYSLIQADKVYAVVEKDAYSPEIHIENISELKNGEKVHYKLYKTVVNTKAYFSRFFAKRKEPYKVDYLSGR